MLKTDILIVDDDPVLAEMLTLHLHRAGYQTQAHVHWKRGVALANNGAFDVIFLDAQIPDGNGLHFFPRFAEAPSQPEIIIMTGSGDPDGANKSIPLGAWGYLEKPCILHHLLLPLTRALQHREDKKKTAFAHSPGIPPLREREEDIRPLSRYFLAKLCDCAQFGRSVFISAQGA